MSASRTPSISWITKEQVVDIGGVIELECSVQYAEEYPVLWMKKGVDGTQDLPISSNAGLIVRDPRYTLHIDKKSSTYILKVRLNNSIKGNILNILLLYRSATCKKTTAEIINAKYWYR